MSGKQVRFSFFIFLNFFVANVFKWLPWRIQFNFICFYIQEKLMKIEWQKHARKKLNSRVTLKITKKQGLEKERNERKYRKKERKKGTKTQRLQKETSEKKERIKE